jgi:predicted nucleic acid-binding protein
MPFVLDASVTACWFFPDEIHPDAFEAWRRSDTDPMLVPLHWWFEVRNTILMAERRGRVDARYISYVLTRLAQLPFVEDEKPDDESVLDLARRHRLTFYDAAYLELAKRERVALATLDDRLAKAAAAEGVPLVTAP